MMPSLLFCAYAPTADDRRITPSAANRLRLSFTIKMLDPAATGTFDRRADISAMARYFNGESMSSR
jgi:hypothetical protein